MKSNPKDRKLAARKAKRPSKRGEHFVKMASLSHQALKDFSKVVKIVKALLIGKCVKKIAEVRKAGAPMETELQAQLDMLQQLKSADHNTMGKTLCNASLGKIEGWSSTEDKDGGTEPPEHPAAAEPVSHKDSGSESVSGQFAQHKKLVEVADLWRGKLEACLQAENERLAHVAGFKAAAAAAKVAEVKGANVRRHVSTGERTQAVFMESLQEADERVIAQELEKKSQRKRSAQQQEVPKPKQPKQPPKAGDIQPTDMDIYRPSSQRDPATKLPPASATRQVLPSAPAYVAKPSEEGRRGGPVGQAPSQAQRRPEKQFRTAAAAPPVAPVEPKMHPSWVAKQAQKAKQVQMSIPVVGAGSAANKKIIFD